MWWTRAERRRGVEAVVVLAAEIMAPMTMTESTGPFLMVSGSSTVRRRGRSLEDDLRTTAPGSQEQLPQAQALRRLAMRQSPRA